MSQTAEILVFELSGFHFFVPLSAVEEVVPSNVITRIPNSPTFLLGLSAVRGKVMGVIDAALRYGLSPGSRSYFLVCQVRGNVTAITIDRPVVAGAVKTRTLTAEEIERMRAKARIDAKFIQSGCELLESTGDVGELRGTGFFCFGIDPDLFVSAEMASRVGEAA